MRICDFCGVPLVKRKREGKGLFEKRRFCSRRCADRGRKTTRVENDQFKARYRQVKTPDGRKMLEHRYVMEQVLGRRLERWEQVHHRNHNRLDNRPENLELVTSKQHGLRHTWHATVKVCVVCGAQYTPHKTKRARQQTCSPACRSELLSRRNAERAESKECIVCGTVFRGLLQQKSCSDVCRLERNRQTKRDRELRDAA